MVRFRLLCGDFLLPNQNRTLKAERPSAWDTRRWPRKTKKSNRILYMTKPLKEELQAWLEKLKQDEQSAPAKRKAGGSKNLRQRDPWSHPADGCRRTQRIDESLVRLKFFLFMQRKAGCANLAQKRPWFGQMCKRCAESVQPLSYIKKNAKSYDLTFNIWCTSRDSNPGPTD